MKLSFCLRIPASTSSSAFSSLLRFCASSTVDTLVVQQCGKILHSIMVEKGILQAEAQSSHALLASLRNSKKWTPLLDTFGFIENCVGRIVQHPVRYLDMLEANQLTVSDNKPLCLLACCIAEQWAYVAKNPDKARKNIAEWIARFFSALEQIGENIRVMAKLQEDMMKASDGKFQSILQKAFEEQQKKLCVAVPAGDKAQDM